MSEYEDYCFECKQWIAPGDNDHIEHDTLSGRTKPPLPPPLGIKVEDGVGVKLERGE